MRLLGHWGRMIIAGAVAAGAALAVSATPAVGGPPGAAIDVVPQPAGWHGLAGGSIVDYWTSESNGTPQRASGALFVPPGRAPAGGWPIMAYDHGTSGMARNCGGVSDPATRAMTWAAEDQILQYFVSRGFAVVAPDYLGLGRFDTGPHPYLELRSEATATIDLLRAARATHPTLSRTWAVMGESQGGQAALGTAHLQRTYAPDLDFRGVIALDPESDLENLLPAAGPWVPNIPVAGGSDATGFVAMTMVGLRETHPEANIDSYLSPRGRELVDAIGGLCLRDIMTRVHGASIGDLLSRQLTTPTFYTALTSYMAVPTTGYDAPILLLTNATDTTVPSPLHAALIAQLAVNGADFRTVIGTGQHCDISPQMWSAIAAFDTHILSTPVKP